MKMSVKIIVFGIVCAIVLFLGVSYMKNNKSFRSMPQISRIVNPIQVDDASVEPFPFMEMTIPYLRSRSYESTLTKDSVLNERPTYISHLAHYDSDGLRINGLLTIPKGEMPDGGWPAVIFIHGYIPPQQYRTEQNYSAYVDYIARNGFVVFKIDLRGHDESEGEAGGSYYSGDYIVDVLNARAALQTSGLTSENKIGLWGHSMAGNVSMRTFAVKPEIPAVVIWAGAVYTYVDMQKYGIGDNSYRPPPGNSERQRKRQLLRETHGDFDVNSDFWRQVAVTDYVQDLQGAVEFHHAVDDTVVNVEYSRGLAELLNNASVEHQLYEYSSGGHNISGANFTVAMQRTVEFYKRHLE